MISAITTHVLDTAAGWPAGGLAVRLEVRAADGWRQLAEAVTDADGRIHDLGPEHAQPGDYRLIFATANYFAADHREYFFPEITVTFTITDPTQHYHVPVLLSPFSFSSYRGS